MRTTLTRITIASIAAAALAGGALAGSAPAFAANAGTIVVDCSGGGLISASITAHVGDTVTISNESLTDCAFTGQPQISGPSVVAAGTSEDYNLVAEGDPAMGGWGDSGNGTDVTFTILPAEAPAAEAAPAAAYLQQIPVPADGTCDKVDDSALAWNTGVSGGWTRQWGEWNNGWVCSRTLTNAGGVWHTA